jgi:MFS family permease
VLQWVVSGYSLALAATLLTAGTLADLVGRRRMFLGGLTAFAAASVLCAAAPSALALIAGRALQGLAGAVLLSSSLALLAQDFTGTARAGALGVWGATVAAAFAVGPLEGGLLTEALGWRALFALDAAVALACLPVATRRLRESRDPDAEGVDWWGTATLSAGLFLGVFALTRGAGTWPGGGAGPSWPVRPERPCCSVPSWSWSGARASPCSTCACSPSPPSPGPRWWCWPWPPRPSARSCT